MESWVTKDNIKQTIIYRQWLLLDDAIYYREDLSGLVKRHNELCDAGQYPAALLVNILTKVRVLAQPNYHEVGHVLGFDHPADPSGAYINTCINPADSAWPF